MTAPLSIALVTSSDYADLPPDEHFFVNELRRRGHRVDAAVWNDATVPWSAFDLCIVRSTWDFHLQVESFLKWVDRVDDQSSLINSPHLIRWNAHKRYLINLQTAGVPVVPTILVGVGEAPTLGRKLAERGWNRVVLKPAVSASSYKTRVFESHEPELREHLECIHLDGEALVQPFIDDVLLSGEKSYIVIDGQLSHVIKRAPFNKGTTERAPQPLTDPRDDETDLVWNSLSHLPEAPVYARVDLVRSGSDEPLVAEIETIEPTLFFSQHPASAVALADAVLKRVLQIRR